MSTYYRILRILTRHARNLHTCSLQFIVLAILATSMHRHLWQMDLHTHVSDANVRFLLSEFSSADRMAEHPIPWGEL